MKHKPGLVSRIQATYLLSYIIITKYLNKEIFDENVKSIHN